MFLVERPDIPIHNILSMPHNPTPHRMPLPDNPASSIIPDMLLIFPPVAKACEPPAGIAYLAASLQAHGIRCQVLDANLEGQLHLLEQPLAATDTWTRRALKNHEQNIAYLRDGRTYRSYDHYSRVVSDVNRLLAVSSRQSGSTVGLADYKHSHLSPLRSADLLDSADHSEQNPFYHWFSSRLEGIFEAQGSVSVKVVGFSLNFLSQALTTFAMIGYVRKRFPGLIIVLGGGLVGSWLQRPGWRNPFVGLVDHLIAGPGEIPLLGLFRVDIGEQRQVIPEYDSLPVHDYFAPGFILPYSSARGCYWNACSFCPERAEGYGYRPVPVTKVMADLQALTAKTKPVLLHLLDSAISPALMQAMIETPSDVPWYGFARISQELADPGFCQALKRSGCVMLKLGLESGDQRVLDRLNKGIELEIVSRALANLKHAGISVYLYLLFGTPAESEVEARRTLDFVVRHRESICFLNLALFNMPICGDETGAYGSEPFYEGDLSLYTDFRHPKGWDRKKVRRFLANEFKREPAVAAILRNDPPQFTSNHAPFFSNWK